MATAQPDDAKTDKLVDGKSADKKPAPDGTVMMALGKYRFAVGTAQYAALQRHTEFRWKEVERVGRMPSQQFVGPGTESIEIEGTTIRTMPAG